MSDKSVVQATQGVFSKYSCSPATPQQFYHHQSFITSATKTHSACDALWIVIDELSGLTSRHCIAISMNTLVESGRIRIKDPANEQEYLIAKIDFGTLKKILSIANFE